MTVRTRAQLNSDADSNLADNTVGGITPAKVRGRVKDVVDSAIFPEDKAAAAAFLAGSEDGKFLTPKAAWDAGAITALTDGATIAVDLATGIDFGGASNGVLALAGNRTLGAASNAKSSQKGVLWFGATGATRTLTLNAAWHLFDDVEAGPYSIATTKELAIAYLVRGTTVFVSAILWRDA